MSIKLVVLAFILISVQGVLAYIQAKAYREAIRDMRRFGNVAVGAQRKYFSQGRVLILACDNDGIITKASEMKGITIFERFHDKDDYNGMSIYQLEEQELAKLPKRQGKNAPMKKQRPEYQALQGLLNRFSDQNCEEEELTELEGA